MTAPSQLSRLLLVEDWSVWSSDGRWAIEARYGVPMGTIAVGTSGWSYEGWAGHFYPDGLTKARWLSHYVTRFPTVELNATFYRLPSQAAVAAWRRAAPEGFCFAVKGSQGVTHRRQLLGADEMVGLLCDRIGDLGPTLGPVLWQLPPRLEIDLARLDGFLAGLPAGLHWAIEFRHPSWLVEETFDLLRRRRVALVAVSSLAMPPVRALTADFAYVRFHGLGGGHGHHYTDEELAPWVSWLVGVAGEGRSGFAYFNNDSLARAPANAARLVQILGDATLAW